MAVRGMEEAIPCVDSLFLLSLEFWVASHCE